MLKIGNEWSLNETRHSSETLQFIYSINENPCDLQKQRLKNKEKLRVGGEKEKN